LWRYEPKLFFEVARRYRTCEHANVGQQNRVALLEAAEVRVEGPPLHTRGLAVSVPKRLERKAVDTRDGSRTDDRPRWAGRVDEDDRALGILGKSTSQLDGLATLRDVFDVRRPDTD